MLAINLLDKTHAHATDNYADRLWQAKGLSLSHNEAKGHSVAWFVN